VKAVPPQAAFDRAAALARLDGDEAFFKELAAIFAEECPRQLADMESALGRSDAAALQRAAHTLKGASYHFEAAATSERRRNWKQLPAAAWRAPRRRTRPWPGRPGDCCTNWRSCLRPVSALLSPL
jgi:HPt (histidine-containing phosphotransfer) domain-containing protein